MDESRYVHTRLRSGTAAAGCGRGRRAMLAGLSVSVSIGLVTGCAEVPTSGPVEPGNPVRTQEGVPYVAFAAAAPRPGDDPPAIVVGFIEAMSAYQPGYETATMFLTPEAASTWEPLAGVTIFEGSRPRIEQVDDNQVRVTVTVVGEVDEFGAYTVENAGEMRELELTMNRAEGEWRIANPPPGTMISEDNFLREFESHDVCFFDPQFEVFVPDPVYLPKNSQVATLLVQMLVDGPSEWLDPAVRTALPEQVALSVSSVPVEAGVATVDLSANAQGLQPLRREQMASQVACTLAGLPEVTHVDLKSDGLSLLGQDGGTDVASVVDRYDPDRLGTSASIYAIQDGHAVSRLDDGELQPVSGELGEAEDLTELAVHPAEGQAVAVASGGAELQLAALEDGAPRRMIFEGAGLVSPDWDRNDLIWAVERPAGGGKLAAVRPDGTEVTVRGKELEELDVTRVSVSPDGTRMVLIGDEKAYVAVVVHDGGDGDYVSIERLRPIGPGGVAMDAGWLSAERIALLMSVEDVVEVYNVDVSGATRAVRGPVPGAVGLSAGAGQQIVVETENGLLVEHQSRTRWVDIGAGEAPVLP